MAPRHAAGIQRLVTSDRAIIEQTRLPDPYPTDGAVSWIEYAVPRHQQGQEYSFVIENAQGEVVGACGLVVSERQDEAELGYWIGRQHWNRGYATGAVRAALRFAFEQARLTRVYALPLSSNAASRRVLEKGGFLLVRLQPAEARWQGQQQALYEVGRNRWRRLGSA